MIGKANNRSKSLVSGALTGGVGHAIGIACTFFLTPLIISGLGTIGYGIWSMIVTITGYYGLVDLGIGVATTKFLSQHVEGQNRDKVCRILNSSGRTYLWLALLIQIVASSVGACVPWFVDLQEVTHVHFFIIASLLGANAACLLLGTIFRSYLRAFGAFSWINLLGIATQVTTAVGIGWVVTHSASIVRMAIVLLSVGIMRLLLVSLVSTFAFQFPWRETLLQKPSSRKELLRFGSLVIAARVVHKLSQKIGTLGAIWIGGPAMVAYYSIAETFCEKAVATTVPVRQMIVPTSSALSETKNSDARQRFLVLAPRVFFAMGLGLSVIIAAYGEMFLSLWVGAEFTTRCWPILVVLLLAIPLRSLGSCLGLLLQGAGHVATVAKTASLEGALLITLTVILCRIYGEIGLAWAVVISTFVSSIIVLPYCVIRTSNVSALWFFGKVVPPAIATGFAGWIAAQSTLMINRPDSYLELFAHCGVVAIVGGVVSFFLCADQILRTTLLRLVKRKLAALRIARFDRSLPNQD